MVNTQSLNSVAQHNQILTSLTYIGRKGEPQHAKPILLLFFFLPCFPAVTIPDGNRSKADNLGMCLVHMLNDFASKAAGFESLQESLRGQRRQLGAALMKR